MYDESSTSWPSCDLVNGAWICIVSSSSLVLQWYDPSDEAAESSQSKHDAQSSVLSIFISIIAISPKECRAENAGNGGGATGRLAAHPSANRSAANCQQPRKKRTGFVFVHKLQV